MMLSVPPSERVTLLLTLKVEPKLTRTWLPVDGAPGPVVPRVSPVRVSVPPLMLKTPGEEKLPMLNSAPAPVTVRLLAPWFQVPPEKVTLVSGPDRLKVSACVDVTLPLNEIFPLAAVRAAGMEKVTAPVKLRPDSLVFVVVRFVATVV